MDVDEAEAAGEGSIVADRVACAALLLLNPQFMQTLKQAKSPVVAALRPALLDNDPLAIDALNYAVVVDTANEIIRNMELDSPIVVMLGGKMAPCHIIS
jgi:hypothetical protein